MSFNFRFLGLTGMTYILLYLVCFNPGLLRSFIGHVLTLCTCAIHDGGDSCL